MKLNAIAKSLILLLSGCNSSYYRPSDPPPTPSKATTPASSSSERFLFVRDRKYGYIDRTGKIVIPAQFDGASDFSEGVAAVQIDTKSVCIDVNGKIVISHRYIQIDEFRNGLAAVSLADKGSSKIKFGYIDRTCKIAIPARFDKSEKFSEGLAAVSVDDGSNIPKYGYINTTGKVVIPLQFLSAYEFKNGLAKVQVAGDGFEVRTIDRTGKLLPVATSPASSSGDRGKFSNGLAWVKIGDRLGYIDKTGKVVIPARYGVPARAKGDFEWAYPYCGIGDCSFHNGLALVTIPAKCGFLWTAVCHGSGYINPAGKLVFKF